MRSTQTCDLAIPVILTCLFKDNHGSKQFEIEEQNEDDICNGDNNIKRE